MNQDFFVRASIPARSRKGWGLTIAFNIAVLITLFSFAWGSSDGREVISWTDELRVLRDFSNITISGAEVKSARVFIDTDRFVVPGISHEENAKLQQIAISGLGFQLHLVRAREQANYLVQIRMGKDFNYAIRNSRRQPSRGYVMISLCRFPPQYFELREPTVQLLQAIRTNGHFRTSAWLVARSDREARPMRFS